MKKSKKIALIIAAALISTGLIFVFAATIDVDFKGLVSMEYSVKTHEVQESFENISVIVTENDVKILPSEDGYCKVICSDSDKIYHAVTVDNNTLKISREDTRKWYERIGFFWNDDLSVTVYLPEQEYNNLYIKSVSGAIAVAEGFSFAEAELYNTSGEISFTGKISGNFTLKTVSGDIFAKGPATGVLNVKSTSGDVKLSDMTLDSLQGKTTSGDIEISSVTVEGSAKLEAVSGDIEFKNYDADTLEIKTTSGDVKGNLLTSKFFVTDTTSGDIRVPDSDRAAGECRIKTTSGDVRIDID